MESRSPASAGSPDGLPCGKSTSSAPKWELLGAVEVISSSSGTCPELCGVGTGWPEDCALKLQLVLTIHAALSHSDTFLAGIMSPLLFPAGGHHGGGRVLERSRSNEGDQAP